jgi:glycosyltransferase involved in cell wall biosynthesis
MLAVRRANPTLSRVALLYTFCLLFGPLALIGLIVLGIFARQRMSRLRLNRAPLPEPAPSLSIVVPAKDEAQGIVDCVHRVLAQDYPNADVVIVDDRSSDGTSQILDDLAAREPRLKPFHVTSLPPGWLGKCHALYVGTRGITSDWLLLVDSDVQLSTDAARQAVALCVDREYDVLSIMPTLDARSFWERSLLPLLAVAWSGAFRISFTNDDSRPNHAFANGQFFLVKREWYERVNGHEAVRDQIVEDVALMRVLKAAGAKTRLMLGQELAHARMHTNFHQMFHGWARIFAGSSGRAVTPIVGVMIFLLGTIVALGIGLFESIHTQQPVWILTTVAHAVLLLGFLGWIYVTAGVSAIYALALPITWPILMTILGYCVYVCRSGNVTWRGSAVTVNRTVGRSDSFETMADGNNRETS